RFSRDWSSDVCSSDLGDVKLSRGDLSLFLVPASELAEKLRNDRVANVVITGALVELLGAHVGIQLSQEHLVQGLKRTLAGKEDRSEERRVGKEGEGRG